MLTIAERRDCDVLVCGGGTAGLSAAVAAARNGARTILLERYGFCGGIAVGALVHTLDGFRSCRDNGQIVVGGIGQEILSRIQRGRGFPDVENPPECECFDPEVFKIAADAILDEAGVEVLYHLFVVAVDREGSRIKSVIAAGKEGLWEFKAKQVIDATGDGDIAAFANAPFEKHDEMQAMSMHFRMGGVKPGALWSHLEKASRSVMDAAYRDGRAPKYGGPWIIRIREGEVTINGTRLYGDGTKTVDLSRAEREGRRDMVTLLEVLRDGVPEFKNAHLLAAATHIGVRETRRIVGDYQITAEDILENKAFDDVVALGSWPIDIHPADGRVGVHPHKENPPLPYPIPFRCLLASELDNLSAAGRCISATHEAHGSTRVSGTAMALGQAAGTAAAMACYFGVAPRKLQISNLQDRLLKQGAILSLPLQFK
jgi:FAD dependent oxidoreductase